MTQSWYLACLHEEVETNMRHRDYKLLNCRLDATKREIEAIANKTLLVLYGFNQWLLKKQIIMEQPTSEKGKAKVADFFQVWTSTRDKLCEIGPGQLPEGHCPQISSS